MKFNLCSLLWHNKQKNSAILSLTILYHLPLCRTWQSEKEICFTRETDLLENKFRTQNEQDLYFPALRIRKIRSSEVPV